MAYPFEIGDEKRAAVGLIEKQRDFANIGQINT